MNERLMDLIMQYELLNDSDRSVFRKWVRESGAALV